MAKLIFARVNALPDILVADTAYIVNDTEDYFKIVFVGTDGVTKREIRNLTDEQVYDIVSGTPVGDLVPDTTSAVIATDSFNTAFSKHENRLNQVRSDTYGDGRWPSNAAERMVKPEGSLTIAVFGDSNVCGRDLPGYVDRTPPMDFNQPVPAGVWTNVMRDTMRKFTGNNNINVNNYGFWHSNTVWDGSAMNNMVAILDDETVTKPDVVILNFGREDLENVENRPPSGLLLPQFNMWMTRMVIELQKRGIVPMIATCIVSPTSGGWDRESYRLMNRALDDLARNMNLNVIDNASVLDDMVNCSIDGYSWREMTISPSGFELSELGQSFVGAYAAQFTNTATIHVTGEATFLTNDDHWNLNKNFLFQVGVPRPGLPMYAETDFVPIKGHAIQTAWIWNIEPNMSATVLVRGTGTNAFDETPVKLVIEPMDGSAKKEYFINQRAINPGIFALERVLSGNLPIGLSKVTFEARDDVVTTATKVYTAPLYITEHVPITSVPPMVIPSNVWSGPGDERLYTPRAKRFVPNGSESFIMNMVAEVTGDGMIGLFSSVAGVPGSFLPTETHFCALGVFVNTATDVAKLQLIAMDLEGNDMPFAVDVGTQWTHSSSETIPGTNIFELNFEFNHNWSTKVDTITVRNKAGAQLATIDTTGFGIPWGGWMGALYDNYPQSYSTKLHSLTAYL